MATAERAAKGWRAKWYVRAPGGKRKHRSYTPPGGGFPSYDAAYKYALDQESDARRGRYIDPSKGKILFEEFAERWLAGKGNQPSTRNRRRSRMRSKLLPKWGDWQLARIENLDVKAWIADLAAQGYTKIYIRDCLRDFKAIMQQAVKGRLIAENPADGVSPHGKSSHPKVALSMPEALIFIHAFTGADRDLVEALFGSGGRWGEITGIKRRSVNLSTNEVSIVRGDILSRGEKGRLYESEGKTKATPRKIKLPSWTTDAFRRALERTPGQPDDRVFRASRGGLLEPGTFYRDVWNPAKELLASINAKRLDDFKDQLATELLDLLRSDLASLESLQEKLEDLTIHCARHTNAMWRVKQGTNMLVLMDQMGWDDVASARPYFHVDDESRRESAKGLETLHRSTRRHSRRRRAQAARHRPTRHAHTPAG